MQRGGPEGVKRRPERGSDGLPCTARTDRFDHRPPPRRPPPCMRLPSRILPLAWILVLGSALAVVTGFDLLRAERVWHVTALATDPARPVGQIIPGGGEASFHWLMQTRQMLTEHNLRVHHVSYDNALGGREVWTSSPYRWWLGLVAGLQHLRTGRPAADVLDDAALVADPLLHALLLVAITLFAAWRFGGGAAALTALGFATLFPLGGEFFPGAPDDRGLIAGALLASVLPVLAGCVGAPSARRRWFAVAGVLGGLAVWLDVRAAAPVLAGVALGGLLASALVERERGPVAAAAWRAWGLSGATTVLLAFLIENAPDRLGGWRTESLHPLHGLAWLGGAELLAWAAAASGGARPAANIRTLARVGSAVLAVAALPAAMLWTKSWGFLASDVYFASLCTRPDSPITADLGAWLRQDGFSATFVATVAPLALLAPALWRLARRSTPAAGRASLALALGPVAVGLGFACAHANAWSRLDALLLALGAATLAAGPVSRSRTVAWVLGGAALAIPGLWQLRPAPATGGFALTRPEAEQLILRDLANWLDRRAPEPGTVVFAPPLETTPLCHFGQLRGIGTFAPENSAGFGTSLSIAGAATIETAQALLGTRQVRYLVIPSWDPYFEDFAALYLTARFSHTRSLLATELRRMHLPPWLRPMAYPMPEITGFERETTLVFEVVDDQGPALATSRLAEYLVETGALERVPDLDEQLQRYPADLGALAARIELRTAAGDNAGAAQLLETLQARIRAGGDRYLAWDRRVRLAIVCGRAGWLDLARRETTRCIGDVRADRLRSLTPGSLFGLLVLSKNFSEPIADPRLQSLATDLLPPALRANL